MVTFIHSIQKMDKKFERKMERFKDKKINRDDKLKILRNTGVQKKKLIDTLNESIINTVVEEDF